MININLLPPEIKKKIHQAKKTADVFSICLIVFLVVIVGTFLLTAAKKQYFDPGLETNQQGIQKVMAELANYKQFETQALLLNERAQIATKIEEKRPVWSQIIQDLINSVPTTVQFTSFQAGTDKSPNFVLSGTTTSEREIIKFKEKLDESDFFKNVAFKSSSTTQQTATTPTGTTPTPEAQPQGPKVTFSLEFDLEQYFAKPKETK